MISKIYESEWKPFFIGDDEYTDISRCNFDKLEPQITVVLCDDAENNGFGFYLIEKSHLNIKVVLAACDSLWLRLGVYPHCLVECWE
jgi:hypothetical protein